MFQAQRLQHEEELRAQKRGHVSAPGTLLAAGNVNRGVVPGVRVPGGASALLLAAIGSSQARHQSSRLCGRACGHGTRQWTAWAPMPMCGVGGVGGQPVPSTGWNMPGAVLCAVQDVKQVQERVRVPQMPLKTGPVPHKVGPMGAFRFGQPNGCYAPPQAEESDNESIGQGVVFQRNEAMPQENLPVERTFIQLLERRMDQPLDQLAPNGHALICECSLIALS
eukprot:Skav232829  [mRNA]  locus=scaffold2600:24301:41120:+ [translate_table: standard]